MKVSPTKVAILNYPQAYLSAVYGIRDILQTVSIYSDVNFEVSIVDTKPDVSEPLKYLIIPPSLQVVDCSAEPWVSGWVKASHAQGTIICTICAGLFWILDMGIIKGREVTTHWGFEQAFREQPELNVNTRKLLIEYSDLITAGGLISWIDLSLAIIRRECDSKIVRLIAQHFIVDAERYSQQPYSQFVPNMQHGDANIIRAQHFLEQALSKNLSNDEIAEHANLTERTLIRRFKISTGHSPKQYARLLRMERAKEMLIESRLSVGETCHRVGYDDISSFVRTFKSVVGESPSVFSRRFSLQSK